MQLWLELFNFVYIQYTCFGVCQLVANTRFYDMGKGCCCSLKCGLITLGVIGAIFIIIGGIAVAVFDIIFRDIVIQVGYCETLHRVYCLIHSWVYLECDWKCLRRNRTPRVIETADWLSMIWRQICVSDLTSYRAQTISCFDDPITPLHAFLHFILAIILEKCKQERDFESLTDFFKTARIKRNESDFQSFTKSYFS